MTLVFHGARALDAGGSRDDAWLLVGGDLITGTGRGSPPTASRSVDVAGRWMVPGFIDLHCHGGGGYAFDDGAAAIRAGLAVHRRHGTTRSVISLVAEPVSRLRAGVSAIAELVVSDPLILGSHLEGPWLAPSRAGAHHRDHLRQPTPADVADLLDAAGGTLRQVTIAPELPGALDAITALASAGITVGVGHTEASMALTHEAFDAGARLLTHAFNAMPGIGHREPGPVMAAIDDPRVTIELILDSRHVHRATAGLLLRAAPGRVALITDAMAAAGAGDGRYRLGSMQVTVAGGQATVSGTSTLAGSTLTQDQALRRAIVEVGLHPADAVAALTTVPADALGLGHRLGRLQPGHAADLVLLDEQWRVTEVWAAGARLR